MEKVKLLNGETYELVTNGVQESNDKLVLMFKPNGRTFDQIEQDFDLESNVSKVYILDSSDETMQSIVGYTQYKGIQKILDYELYSYMDEDETKTETGTVFKVTLSKPDIQKKVADIQETVDFLVAEQLG